MSKQNTIPQRNVSELRVTTRLFTLFAIIAGLFYTRAFINSGLLAAQNSMMANAAIFFLLLAVFGLVLTFHWEKWGGIMAIMGGLILGVIAFTATNGSWWKTLFYSMPFVVTGLLALLAWRRHGKA